MLLGAVPAPAGLSFPVVPALQAPPPGSSPVLRALSPTLLFTLQPKNLKNAQSRGILYLMLSLSARAAVTTCCRLGGLHNRSSFLKAVEAENSEIKTHRVRFLVTAPSWLEDGCLLPVCSRGGDRDPLSNVSS